MISDDFPARWKAWTVEFYSVTQGLVEQAGPALAGMSISEPLPVAVMLISRTVSNFTAAQVLLRELLIVEARILTRCCLENLFWMAALCAEGARFTRLMEQDSAGKAARHLAFVIGGGDDLPEDMKAQFELELKSIPKELYRKASLTPKDVALRGVTKDFYLPYCSLSADAAHPTVTSLQRHVRRQTAELVLDMAPSPSDEEVLQTYSLLSYAVLGACAGFSEVSEVSDFDNRLAALTDSRSEIFPKPKPD